jgi:hypothetical protein
MLALHRSYFLGCRACQLSSFPNFLNCGDVGVALVVLSLDAGGLSIVLVSKLSCGDVGFCWSSFPWMPATCRLSSCSLRPLFLLNHKELSSCCKESASCSNSSSCEELALCSNSLQVARNRPCAQSTASLGYARNRIKRDWLSSALSSNSCRC